MPIIPNGGCNEREDTTLIGETVLAEATGIEYLPGKQGVYTTRGRSLFTNVSGTTGRGLYWAGFDNGADYLLYHESDNYRAIAVSGAASTVNRSSGSDTDPIVGVHYAGRHYLANGVSNLVAEQDSASGVTFRSAGMVQTGVTIGVSVTQGSGAFSTTTGLVYWLTEYDNARGIESIYGSTSASTGGFSNRDSVILTISGTTRNVNSSHYRVYRTTDGGVFPDGGLLATIGITNTSYTDSYATVATLLSPSYGTIEINGLAFDRDVAPPVLSTITEYEDSLCGFPPNSRSFRFSAAGYPESWPTIYEVPLDSELHDIGMANMELNGVMGLFTRDSVWRLMRLPREVDSAFASGEVRTRVTGERGCVSRRGVARYTVPGSGQMLAFIARDGIFVTNLDAVLPVTDGVNWSDRVEPLYLESSVLTNDPVNRRLVFLYRKRGEEYNTGVMYLNYETGTLRVTHPDHGALTDGTVCAKDGSLELFTVDTRSGSGNIYIEGADSDASLFFDSVGRISWRVRTSTFMPAGPHGTETIERIVWRNDNTTDSVRQFHVVDGVESPGRAIDLSDETLIDIGVTKEANTVSFGLEGSSLKPIGLHWFDPLGVESTPLGGRKGA